MHDKCSSFFPLLIWITILISVSFSFFPRASPTPQPPPNPSKGLQASQPAVSQSAAAFGHHWVPCDTHIRQTVCWDGLWHLGVCLSALDEAIAISAPSQPLAPTFSASLYLGPCMSTPTCFKQCSFGLGCSLQISGGSEMAWFWPEYDTLLFPCMFTLFLNLFSWHRH